MNTPPATPPRPASAVGNSVVQQRPGYGIPSQDPRPAAQFALRPEEAEREERSVFMGGGLMIGLAAGASLGVVVGGPLVMLAGGMLGAFGGALAGEAAGTWLRPEDLQRRLRSF